MKGKQKDGVAATLAKLVDAVRGAFAGPAAPVLRPIPVRRPVAPQRHD
ncbi:hypothetical protein [Methylocystis sp. JR02]|nr:hypothetical protein [Methylocystis sp. JR02]MDJ0448446.1 hypothetical protein [Methylocystis sp. JR02]